MSEATADDFPNEQLLERAIEIATTAHAGQRDLAGEPYILHCLRVMMAVSEDPAERIVALLHGVVEQGNVSLARLRREGFSPRIVEAIDALTRRPGESEMDAAARAKANAFALPVKLADLNDRTRQCLLVGASEADRARLPEYRAVRAFLLRLPDRERDVDVEQGTGAGPRKTSGKKTD